MKHGSLNPITGDQIKTRVSDTYADNFDAIFRKPKKEEEDKKKEVEKSYKIPE